MRIRKTLIVVIVAIAAIALIITLLLITKKGDDSVIKDKDTSESYDPSVNNTPTGGSQFATPVTLFGVKDLTEIIDKKSSTGDISIDIVDDIKKSLYSYSVNRQKNKYKTITVRPQSISLNSSSLTGEIRLGQTSTILSFTVKPNTDWRHGVITINDGHSDGPYVFVGGLDTDALQYSIVQRNHTSTDLLIETFAYRESALRYLKSAGYQPSDFNIIFNNYENPFK